MKTIKVDKKYSYLSPNFIREFGSMPVVKPKDKRPFQTKVLGRPMTDALISKEFDPEPVTLGDLDQFLDTAAKKQWYICYIQNRQGVLWAVSVDWFGDGWGVRAGSVEGPGCWGASYRVFSRSFSAPMTLPEFIMVGSVKYIKQ